MYTLSLLLALTFVIATSALSLQGIQSKLSTVASSKLFSKRASCPSVWTDVGNELADLFVTGLVCNDLARAAIRAGFHDCFTGDGCDGSLILADELANANNNGLQEVCGTLEGIATSHDVGVADMIQFAAGMHFSNPAPLLTRNPSAVALCPGGPRIPTYVGRSDTAATGNTTIDLPGPSDSASSIIDLFASKGFSVSELVTLIGAHTISRQFFVDTSRAGAPQDSTPGLWDTSYYRQTLTGTAPFVFESDANLAQDSQSQPYFNNFAVNGISWNDAFRFAYLKMSLIGVEGGTSALTDCTSALPSRGIFGVRGRESRGS